MDPHWNNRAMKETRQATNYALVGEEAEAYSGVSGHDSGHICRRRRDDQGFWVNIEKWGPPLVHLVYIFAFVGVLLHFVDGHRFTVGATSILKREGHRFTWQHRLSQSDVSTLISLGLVMLRLVTASWQGLMLWRCAFILLEKAGLNVPDVVNLITWKKPVFFGRKRRQGRWYGWVIFLIVILTWPSQFINPLVSGAVLWIPDFELLPPQTMGNVVGKAIASPEDWSWFNTFADIRQQTVKMCAGLAVTGTPVTTDRGAFPLTESSRLINHRIRSLHNGTRIHNVTVPAFDIKSLTWLSDPLDETQFPTRISDAFHDEYGLLNISSSGSPGTEPNVGNAAILKITPWESLPDTSLPPSTKLTGEMYAVVLVARPNNFGRPLDNEAFGFPCTRDVSSRFQPLPHDAGFWHISYSNNVTNCYAVARISVEAGVRACKYPNCEISDLSTAVIVSTNARDKQAIKSDALVSTTFMMMPEVMNTMSYLPEFNYASTNGSIEPYLRNMIVQSYQGTWSGLTDIFSDQTAQKGPIVYNAPSPVVRASILKTRLWIFVGFNLIFTLAGVMLFILQVRCEHKTVLNPIIAMIMLDNSEVLERDATGLCNAVRIADIDDKKEMWRLHLRRSPYYHPQLKLVNR